MRAYAACQSSRPAPADHAWGWTYKAKTSPRWGGASLSREGPKDTKPTTDGPTHPSKSSDRACDRTWRHDCSRRSMESAARNAGSRMPSYAACQDATCTSATARESSDRAGRISMRANVLRLLQYKRLQEYPGPVQHGTNALGNQTDDEADHARSPRPAGALALCASRAVLRGLTLRFSGGPHPGPSAATGW
jgi:hypothetical protein